MAFGIQVRDQNNQLVDLTDLVSTCRFLGAVTISGSSGSVTLPNSFTSSTDTYFVLNNNNYTPVLSLSGSTLSWSGQPSGMNVSILCFRRASTSTGTGYGFYIKNSSGIVTVDDNFSPISIVSSGTSTYNSVANRPDGGQDYVHNITKQAGDIIMVDFPVGRTVSIIGETVSTNAQTINYKIARRTTGISTDTHGLRVRNSSNTVIFDSGTPILNCIGADTGSLNTWQTSKSIPAGTAWISSGGTVGEVVIQGGSGSQISWVIYLICVGFRRINSTSMQSYGNCIGSGVVNSAPVGLIGVDSNAVLTYILGN